MRHGRALASSTACQPIDYLDFVRAKIITLPPLGLPIAANDVHPILKGHQKELVRWAVEGGRRAIFAAFGLGKSLIQLEIMRQIGMKLGGKQLIVVPLTVLIEFKRDAQMLGMEPRFIQSTAGIYNTFVDAHSEGSRGQLYLTNYESVREGKIDLSLFNAASLDEASCLRGFGGTKTFREFMRVFDGMQYKFVATATPSPNEYVELLAYAAFLEVMDVGQAKTRFFKRNSEDADNLTIHPHKQDEFWLWVNSWAAFVQRPSDLGFSDDGYELPELDVRWHEVASDHALAGEEKGGQGMLLKREAIGLVDAAREKRESLDARIAKMMELRAEDPGAHRIIWHDLEREREAIEAAVPRRWFGHWGEVKDGHPIACGMYDRHYSARAMGEDRKLILGPGEKMVLLTGKHDALFGWRKFIDDNRTNRACMIRRGARVMVGSTTRSPSRRRPPSSIGHARMSLISMTMHVLCIARSWPTGMADPTLADIIANDLAMKCGEDVSGAMQRTFRLCDSQAACVFAGVAGASVAMANLTGAMYASAGEEVSAEMLDAIWRDLIRPLALSGIGDRKPFLAMLDMVAAKPMRINGDDA